MEIRVNARLYAAEARLVAFLHQITFYMESNLTAQMKKKTELSFYHFYISATYANYVSLNHPTPSAVPLPTFSLNLSFVYSSARNEVVLD